MRWSVVSVAFVLAAMVTGCGVIPVPSPPVDPSLFDIHAANGTTIPVSVVVDGQVAAVVPAGGEVTIPSGTLPAPPYTIEARIASGRVLDSVTVAPGSVTRVVNSDGTGSASGVAIRTGLSCGQFTLWVGVRPSGPAPGPGAPGDCDP